MTNQLIKNMLPIEFYCWFAGQANYDSIVKQDKQELSSS